MRLARIESEEPGWIWFMTNNRGQARLLVDTDEGVRPGFWFDVLPPGRIRVGVRDDPDLGYAEVSSTPGGFVGYLRSFDYDESLDRQLGRRGPHARPRASRLAEFGIRLEVERGLDPLLCTRLAAPGPGRRQLMRIAFLTWRDSTHPDGGGSEVFVEQVARGLVQRGHEVTIVCARHGDAPRHERPRRRPRGAHRRPAHASTPAACSGSPGTDVRTPSWTSSTACRSGRRWCGAAASSPWSTTSTSGSGRSSTPASAAASAGTSRAGSRPRPTVAVPT